MNRKQRRSPNLRRQYNRYQRQISSSASGGIGYGARVGQTIRGALARGQGGRFTRAEDQETLRQRNERLRAILDAIKLRLRTPTRGTGKKPAASGGRGKKKPSRAANTAKNRRDTVRRIVERGWLSQPQADAFLAFIEGGGLDADALALLEALGLVDEDGELTRAGRLLKQAYDREKLDIAKRALELEQKTKEQKNIAQFGRAIRAAGRILWKDPIDIVGFVDALQSAVNQGYARAWSEGAAACGILPGDRTPEETQTLNGFVNAAYSSIFPLAQFIAERSQPNGGLWRDLQYRLDVWINRYNEVRNTAQQMACKDQKSEWVLGEAEHCSTCLKLSGRVYRNSVWQKYDIRPRDTRPGRLECRGFNCQCDLVPTDKPVTPGRPPDLP